MSRKICVFTGTRAEYGLLEPLISELRNEAGVELQLLVTGMHLSPEFGLTHQEIDAAGCHQVEKVEILLSSDSPVGISKAMGLGMISFSEALQRLEPDLLIGVGDRFELLAAAAAATVMRIPIAHIHGGETTEGAMDESFRHAITKMSHWHFASTEIYRNRIIRMGEHPDRVFNTGAPGIDNIRRMELMSVTGLEKELPFRITDNTLLVTFHPVTLEAQTAGSQFGKLLDAIDQAGDVRVVFTKPNADTGGRIIISMIDDYVKKNPGKAVSFVSMGQKRYLSALKHAACIVGNSSSGIIEAPSLKTGTVNIGNRQKGRVRAESVIDCEPDSDAIASAIKTCLSTEFRSKLGNITNPYESQGEMTSRKIARVLLSSPPDGPVMKSFYDLKT
ncbi:UDP-N-acetylglucosamine 2-epimerase [Natronogracilivirga saccharolytica]|uniref:UDP-N-acetylglucosamine 2-epimerase (Hydrolyzing) n=1 Tax=Natronogracilivirga saccharolytica TaxID=2812953 RepID=A0A8J7RU48_9BACT|nr:UDP-N-acetylglucosamine 2-epimerase [Natronogracilivirga saccharolytica]MBP3193949.1 UDP-N-acetylglucosamine 2-epimerase (hydrolyzing) [Natronogracilivirga saccharolytica]